MTQVPADQLKISIDSSSFFVGNDLNQLYDLYTRQTEFDSATTSLNSQELTMIGKSGGLLLPIRVAIPDIAGVGLKVEGLSLDFDSSAPNIDENRDESTN